MNDPCAQEQIEKLAVENRRLVDINTKLARELRRYKVAFGDIDFAPVHVILKPEEKQ
jgi:hypothetical protein